MPGFFNGYAGCSQRYGSFSAWLKYKVQSLGMYAYVLAGFQNGGSILGTPYKEPHYTGTQERTMNLPNHHAHAGSLADLKSRACF